MGQGKKETGNDTELPRRIVEVKRPYYLGQGEVTVAEFRRFVADTGYVTDAERRGRATGWHGNRWGRKSGISWRNPGFAQDDEHPAVCLSCRDARAFCRWLGRKFRLPSEAQWEYAARAGSESCFPRGDPDEVCRHGNGGDLSAKRLFPEWNTASCDDGSPWTAPGGSYAPNPWGFYDLLGNAWEWCADPWHPDFRGAPLDERVWGDASSGGKRVLKGGSWYFEPQDLRPAWRHWHRVREATNGAGFRVLLECEEDGPPLPANVSSEPAAGR